MEPLFFVMAILGCGDGQAGCQQARIVPARYETMAQCRAALPDQIAHNTDLSYPVITADCRQGGTRMASGAKASPRG